MTNSRTKIKWRENEACLISFFWAFSCLYWNKCSSLWYNRFLPTMFGIDISFKQTAFTQTNLSMVDLRLGRYTLVAFRWVFYFWAHIFWINFYVQINWGWNATKWAKASCNIKEFLFCDLGVIFCQTLLLQSNDVTMTFDWSLLVELSVPETETQLI